MAGGTSANCAVCPNTEGGRLVNYGQDLSNSRAFPEVRDSASIQPTVQRRLPGCCCFVSGYPESAAGST
jgi:hypothetical protein